jgi:NAD(P)-dependent dehydrogenase (short-subunit alcohol dehydrogenase family)
MHSLKGKKVVVTGAGRGIGKVIAETFLNEGCKVWVLDKAKSGLDQLIKGFPECQTTLLDVSNESQILNFFTELKTTWGSCDVLINNAGISQFTQLEECETASFDEIISVNLRAPFIFAREFARLHPKNAYGRIINIASTRFVMSEPGGEAYGATKGGLVSLTHALANSLSGSGITVNCISPGWIHCGDETELTKADHNQHPSGRVGKPSDVASIAVFLSQTQNDFINGEEIRVDGGMTRKMIYI